MPRAFTAVEKQTIHDKLMEAGRACFLRFGLKKTTIEDLVKPTGIAKASFYLFFAHKEALYVEVIMAEMPAMMDRLMSASFGKTEDIREALILLMKAIVHEIETNELTRILLDDPMELERLAVGLDFEGIMARSAAMFAPLFDEISRAQERGEMIEGDPQQIIYSLGLIKLLPVNRDRVPKDLYDAMLNFAPQVIADGLTCPARRSRKRT
ncbi:TetR/AcrR family transcriptional regulator [Candidatus Bipolaricaulota bacterium]|nr:TetR/AcrR family transcriptional regulator [Candidatus Bipolaricaulota bacterium]